MHYLQARPPGDQSGITLRMTRQSTPFSAGMVNYAQYFTIPPGKPQHPIENQCCYSGFEILKGFAFRVHTHALGRCALLPCPALLCPALPCPAFIHSIHHEGLQAAACVYNTCAVLLVRIKHHLHTGQVSRAYFLLVKVLLIPTKVPEMLWLGRGTMLHRSI